MSGQNRYSDISKPVLIGYLSSSSTLNLENLVAGTYQNPKRHETEESLSRASFRKSVKRIKRVFGKMTRIMKYGVNGRQRQREGDEDDKPVQIPFRYVLTLTL
jgi:hypothetical protein